MKLMNKSNIPLKNIVFYENALGITIFLGPAGVGTVPLNSFGDGLGSPDTILVTFDASMPVLCFRVVNF